MKIYVEAKSKADLIRRLAAGEEISGYNYSMFGGGGHYMLDDNLEDGTIIAVYTKKVQGNPVAKAWGTWTNKVLKAESFEAMSLDENDTIICDQCNKNVEGDSIYADFTLKCDCGNILYEDNSYGPFDIADYYGAESFSAPYVSKEDEEKTEQLVMWMGERWHDDVSKAKRSGYIMGIAGIIVGWFINKQFFCKG